MRLAFVGVCVLAWSTGVLAGLNDRLPPEAYVKSLDQQIARTGEGLPGRPGPCAYEEIIDGNKAIETQPTELCVKMLPQQHWRGLWRNDFEGSRFCPEPAKTCDDKTRGDKIWLSRTPGRPEGGLYRIDFIGRRTMYKGPYGHMGISDHELFIDRIIAMREVEAPPPPPTKAQMREWEKRCEAAGNCIPLSKLRDLSGDANEEE